MFSRKGLIYIEKTDDIDEDSLLETALEAGADIVVACSSDDEYAEAVPQIAKLVGDKAIVVVAGDPACKEDLMAKGIENFISVRSNVLHTLEDYQAKLGIK